MFFGPWWDELIRLAILLGIGILGLLLVVIVGLVVVGLPGIGLRRVKLTCPHCGRETRADLPECQWCGMSSRDEAASSAGRRV